VGQAAGVAVGSTAAGLAVAAACLWGYRRRRAPRSLRGSACVDACCRTRPAIRAGDDTDIGVPLLPRAHATKPDDAMASSSARHTPTAPVAGMLSFATSDFDDVLLRLLPTADAAVMASSGDAEGEEARLPTVHMTWQADSLGRLSLKASRGVDAAGNTDGLQGLEAIMTDAIAGMASNTSAWRLRVAAVLLGLVTGGAAAAAGIRIAMASTAPPDTGLGCGIIGGGLALQSGLLFALRALLRAAAADYKLHLMAAVHAANTALTQRHGAPCAARLRSMQQPARVGSSAWWLPPLALDIVAAGTSADYVRLRAENDAQVIRSRHRLAMPALYLFAGVGGLLLATALERILPRRVAGFLPAPCRELLQAVQATERPGLN
jgi:hypothetical protein